MSIELWGYSWNGDMLLLASLALAAQSCSETPDE
jgi:hypothetical protein